MRSAVPAAWSPTPPDVAAGVIENARAAVTAQDLGYSGDRRRPRRPQIPLVGKCGIESHDELELELR